MSLVTQVNYVPNDLETADAQGAFRISTSLFGLAVPLLLENVWPVSWLSGAVANPLPGLLIIALIVVAASWTFARFRHAKAVDLVLVAGVLLHLGILALVTEHHPASVGAKNFLTQIWSAPAGQRYEWWR
jgi:hypothetical protein